MVAKRRLDFGTPGRKRARTTTMVLYRSPRSEMKHFDTAISYTAATNLVQCLNLIAGGGGINGRVGSKIKIYRVQAIISQPVGASQPVRMELLLPEVATAAPLYAYDTLIDPDSNTSLVNKFLTSGTTQNPGGYMLNYKLPYGIVSNYNSNVSTSLTRNAIYMCLATQTASTFTVNCRIWFTDA